MLKQLTIDELNAEAPNGLHDAIVESFEYDVMAKCLQFRLDLWVGDAGQKDLNERELYRRGVLRFNGVTLFTKTESAYFNDEQMTLLDWSLQEDLEEKSKLPESFSGKFFDLAACYCQFRIGCEEVGFAWTETEAAVRK